MINYKETLDLITSGEIKLSPEGAKVMETLMNDTHQTKALIKARERFLHRVANGELRSEGTNVIG